MEEQLFDHLERLLDAPEDRRDEMINSLDMTSDQRTRLRLLLDSATAQDTLDDGIAAMFPTLLRPSGFPDAGYQIIRELGRGGMGVVHLAEDTRLERYVAIKVVGATAWDDSGEARLLHEARAAARLDHPGIVPVYHTGHLDRAVYIISAYVEGETLADSIGRLRGQCGLERGDRRPLRRDDPATSRRWIDRAIETVRDIARAVEYAHSQSVIHRDLKPSNILLDEHEQPFLTDFGIAKLTDQSDATRSTGPIGTLLYMSPEQVGAVTDDIGPRTDVYGLGVVLFEALTLRRPYEVDSLGGLIRLFDRESPPDPRMLNTAVPRSVASICRKAMSTRPTQRHTCAEELMVELEHALRGEFAATRWSMAPVRRLLRRRRLAVSVTGAVAVTAGVTAGIVARESIPRATVLFPTADISEVIIREIDPATRVPGPPFERALNRNRLRLPPGHYRLSFMETGSRREISRLLEDGDVEVIQQGTHPGAPSTTGMTLIDGGVYTVGITGSQIPVLAERRVEVGSFWIDTNEVSNAEYRRFVIATDRDPPPIWPVPYDAGWDPLPVVTVTQEDACAYAEWIGKRLPTDTEWEIAAAGADRHLYVWGDDYELPTGITLNDQSNSKHRLVFDASQTRGWYLNGVVPVGTASDDLDRTPAGVINLCGNVSEWTESVLVPNTTGIDLLGGFAKGNSWSVQGDWLMTNQQTRLAPPSTRSVFRGFRCAASQSVAESR